MGIQGLLKETVTCSAKSQERGRQLRSVLSSKWSETLKDQNFSIKKTKNILLRLGLRRNIWGGGWADSRKRKVGNLKRGETTAAAEESAKEGGDGGDGQL